MPSNSFRELRLDHAVFGAHASMTRRSDVHADMAAVPYGEARRFRHVDISPLTVALLYIPSAPTSGIPLMP